MLSILDSGSLGSTADGTKEMTSILIVLLLLALPSWALAHEEEEEDLDDVSGVEPIEEPSPQPVRSDPGEDDAGGTTVSAEASTEDAGGTRIGLGVASTS